MILPIMQNGQASSNFEMQRPRRYHRSRRRELRERDSQNKLSRKRKKKGPLGKWPRRLIKGRIYRLCSHLYFCLYFFSPVNPPQDGPNATPSPKACCARACVDSNKKNRLIHKQVKQILIGSRHILAQLSNLPFFLSISIYFYTTVYFIIFVDFSGHRISGYPSH